ncbi:MAG: 50S ribosomal protein L32 [Bacillota bacterium]
MGVPKRKHSKARVRSRRSEWRKINSIALVECPQCHKLKPPHRACVECGHYNQRSVIDVTKKSKKK